MNRILTRPCTRIFSSLAKPRLLFSEISPHMVNECKKNILRKLRTFYKKKKKYMQIDSLEFKEQSR